VSEPVAPPPQAAKQEAQNPPVVDAKPRVVERRDENKVVEKAPPPASEVAETQPPAAAAPAPAAIAPPAAPSPAARRSFSAAADAVRSVAQANTIAADILSPDPMSRWRITAGRIVEHSTDGGATWQEQPTGATSTLTAGSAPSPLVCWMVGQGGVVLLSTNGRTWRRIEFPVTTDLVSVRATDERIATVTDVNGRTYATTDGGGTWTQR
jgi:photosystem II stability/assembly factor-like uncharacterized protein